MYVCINCKSLHLWLCVIGAADIVVKLCVCVALGKPIILVQLVIVAPAKKD